jgi:uncharacterized protein
MNTKEIYKINDHRPVPMPEGKWIIYQEWHNVLFLHWAVKPAMLKHFVPGKLELQTFDGRAWISLVVFKLSNVRPRYLPPIPYISDSDEINIRTYVEFKGKPGIYFLSMELGNPISNLLAKYLTGLPYRYSVIENKPYGYRSGNQKFDDEMDVEYEVRSKIENKTTLDKWLTERYALFQDKGNKTIIGYEIHHYEWPLHEVILKKNHLRYDQLGSLIHKNPDHMHYSPLIEVLTWGRQSHKIKQNMNA